MKEFVALRPKTYSYLMDDDNEHKKAKGTKKCVIKIILNDYKDCLLNNKIMLKSQQRLKSKAHCVMMIKDYKRLIKLQHILMNKCFLKYIKVRC